MSTPRSSTVNIQATVVKDGSTLNIVANQTNTVSDGSIPFTTVLALAAGNNTINIFSAATGLMIVVSDGFFNNRKIKGVNADTGVVIGNPGSDGVIYYQRFPAAAMASIVINLGVAETLTFIFN